MIKSTSTYLTIFTMLLAVNVVLGDKESGRNHVLLKMKMDSLSNKAAVYTNHYTLHYQQVKLKLAKISS